MKSFEHIPAAASPESSRRKSLPLLDSRFEVIKRIYEYRDEKGILIGRTVLELDQQETGLPEKTLSGKENGKGLKIRRWTLEGSKNGEHRAVDVLALANKRGTKLYMATERLRNYAYLDEEHTAFVPPLESPLDIAIALHELGHADQYRDSRFERIAPLYEIGRIYGIGAQKIPLEDLRDIVIAVQQAIPEAKELIDRNALTSLRLTQNEIYQFEEHLRAIIRAGEQSAAKIKLRRDIEEEQEKLDAGAQKRIMKSGLRNVIALPTRVMERDATKRAFLWMRRIRELAGIDLFAKTQVASKTLDPGIRSRLLKDGTCSRSVKVSLDTAGSEEELMTTGSRDSLGRALESYGAKPFRLYPPGNKKRSAGIMPQAGSNRKTK